MYTHQGKVHLRIDKRRARCYSAAITTKGDADMTARFENSFNMTGSCTRCNESCCASSSCAGNAAAMNTALLLTMDTVIAVSIFAVLFAIIGIIGIVIISAAIILCVVIIRIRLSQSIRLNTALAPLISYT